MIYFYGFLIGAGVTAGLLALASWTLYVIVNQAVELNDVEIGDE